MAKYFVKNVSGRTLTVEAKDSTQAKRKACKYWGFKPSDYWLGITSMHARRIA
jgi:hypothetical protein